MDAPPPPTVSPTPPDSFRADPELCRLVVALGSAPVLRLWLLARDLTRTADGSGFVTKSELVAALPAAYGSGRG